MRRLVVPVGPLHEPHGDAATVGTRPVDERLQVGMAVAQVGLDDDARGVVAVELRLQQQVAEERQRQPLQRGALHVEVEEDAPLLGRHKERQQPRRQPRDRAVGVDGVHLAVERRDLDGDVDARDGTLAVVVEQRVRLPSRCGLRQRLDEVEIAGCVGLRLAIRQRGLAQQVDREGDARLPHRHQLRQHIGRRLARHKGFGHAPQAPLNLADRRPGNQPRAVAHRLEAQLHPGGRLVAGLREVLLQVPRDLLGVLQHREDIHKPEHLDLEGLVLHRPLHHLPGPEVLVEDGGRLLLHAGEDLAAEAFDAGFECVAHGLSGVRRKPLVKRRTHRRWSGRESGPDWRGGIHSPRIPFKPPL